MSSKKNPLNKGSRDRCVERALTDGVIDAARATLTGAVNALSDDVDAYARRNNLTDKQLKTLRIKIYTELAG